MSVLSKAQLILPETEQVEQKIASLKLTGSPLPLKLGHSLDAFKKADLTPIIGTEFETGVQVSDWLRAPIADELIKDLAILVSQRGVVFFRDQNITIDEQKILGAKLGELTGKPESSKLHVHPVTEEGSELGDEISVITSDRTATYNNVYTERTKFSEVEWHSDITFEPIPSDYAILKIHTLPATGGDTLWASGYEVYDRLSPSFAKYLKTLEAVHEARFFHAIADGEHIKLRDGERGSPGNIGSQLEAVHPVIRYLFNLVSYNHDLQVRFRWEKNSLAIWDNRSNFHAATHDYAGKRVGDRVVSLGEKPYFNPNSKSRREALDLEKK